MDKEKLKNMANNPNFIPGIYNYCDRWCERCAFTRRCMNYALGEEEFSDLEKRDIHNEEFWEKLHETLHATLELIREMAAEKGIDPDDIDYTAYEAHQQRLRNFSENHQIASAARNYAQMVDEWFESSEAAFDEKQAEWNLKAQMNLKSAHSSPDKEISEVGDGMDIIRWYQHQIHVKLRRALHGKYDREIEETDDFPKDSEGSAKVALIGMDRSIAAWGKLRDHFSESEDEILAIMIHLDRLRKLTESEFPAARSFVRPGFDEPQNYS